MIPTKMLKRIKPPFGSYARSAMDVQVKLPNFTRWEWRRVFGKNVRRHHVGYRWGRLLADASPFRRFASIMPACCLTRQFPSAIKGYGISHNHSDETAI